MILLVLFLQRHQYSVTNVEIQIELQMHQFEIQYYSNYYKPLFKVNLLLESLSPSLHNLPSIFAVNDSTLEKDPTQSAL